MQIQTIYSNKTCAVCAERPRTLERAAVATKSGRAKGGGKWRLKSERFEAVSFENQLPFLSSYICSGCIRLMHRTLAAVADGTE